MDIFVGLVLFWFGAVFGSFAGAVVWRIKKKKDFVKGRSECEHCHHMLAPLDLIPIFSWVFLRGRCRYCHKPIGASTVLIEIGLGVAFLLSYVAWPYGLETPQGLSLFGLWLVALVLLAMLLLYDARWSTLPDKIVYPLIVLAGIFFILCSAVAGFSIPMIGLELLYALTPIAGLYSVLYFASRGAWVGFGDVKLGIALGLLLGWQGALLALVLANLLGFIVVLPGLLSNKLTKASRVPFGPFLIVASFIAFLYGDYLIGAYMQLIML